MVKIAILGAGINGLSCAVKIKEKYQDYEVELISKEFTPGTTGDGSGGLWYIFLCGNTPDHLLLKWGIETFKYLHKLWLEGGYDVIAMPIYSLYREQPTDLTEIRPSWSKDVFGFRVLGGAALDYLSRFYSVKYVAGHTFTTFQVLPPTILKHLHQRFIRAGGRIVPRNVTSLKDPFLGGYDVVINCTGLGAREIVPDSGVYPIRGQILKANAPWLNTTVMDQTTCHYMIPNTECCVLGGTHQDNNFNTKMDDNDTKHILDGCFNMVPGLKHAPILSSWVGLRPGRDSLRLEAERRDGRLLIHNYGHGNIW
ncbi:hypothetical protein O0L34_g15488 [Tuta absoluta]|nr:hypothetical protein O0L34_g15488 [Tuta absoluta]